VPDINKIGRDLGWKPEIALETIISDIAAHMEGEQAPKA